MCRGETRVLRAAGKYVGCGNTACSVGTIYGGNGHLYTSGVRPALLATPCLASLAIILLAPLATPYSQGRHRNAAYSQQRESKDKVCDGRMLPRSGAGPVKALKAREEKPLLGFGGIRFRLSRSQAY
jgi:hypothetical protein